MKLIVGIEYIRQVFDVCVRKVGGGVVVAEWTPAVTPWGCFHYRFSSQYSTNQLLSQP